MKDTISFKTGLEQLASLWNPGQFKKALALVDHLLHEWPDNPLLLVKKAELIQLQETTEGPTLDEARQALERAADLDEESPSPFIELGFFLFAVKDDAQRALDYFTDAEDLADKLLKESRSGKKAVLNELAENKRNGKPFPNGSKGKSLTPSRIRSVFKREVRKALGPSEDLDLKEYEELSGKPESHEWTDAGDGVEWRDSNRSLRLIRSSWSFPLGQTQEHVHDLQTSASTHATVLHSLKPEYATTHYLVIYPPSQNGHSPEETVSCLIRAICSIG